MKKEKEGKRERERERRRDLMSIICDHRVCQQREIVDEEKNSALGIRARNSSR
jgi:hypothetical protein